MSFGFTGLTGVKRCVLQRNALFLLTLMLAALGSLLLPEQ
jgi:hypothetical protein